jgi:hypothetical protein
MNLKQRTQAVKNGKERREDNGKVQIKMAVYATVKCKISEVCFE